MAKASNVNMFLRDMANNVISHMTSILNEWLHFFKKNVLLQRCLETLAFPFVQMYRSLLNKEFV